MKTFITSLVMLALAIGFSLFLSIEIRASANAMADLTQKLPAESTAPELRDEIAEIEKIWKNNKLLFTISLSHSTLTEVEMRISALYCTVNIDQNSDYLEAKGALYVTVMSIISNQALGYEGIL